uniref:Uncharacterized protein n=1 Tax=Siphoviridae sp. cttDR14 TaxID=2826490 RepID=A0A8S5M262_9CAUD|nr:MAG TPA: hypothetical protein [Siphoviridae sp. cttDR14]
MYKIRYNCFYRRAKPFRLRNLNGGFYMLTKLLISPAPVASVLANGR